LESQVDILPRDKLGGVKFARADHITAMTADPNVLDVPGAKLLGNRFTMLACANPDPNRPKHGKWGARAAGHGIVRFNKTTRKITIECWPRGCDVSNPKHRQYAGWPVTIAQEDNDGRGPRRIFRS
jgi:hypothetical protein